MAKALFSTIRLLTFNKKTPLKATKLLFLVEKLEPHTVPKTCRNVYVKSKSC